MAQLSERCLREALRNPCQQKALSDATKKCKSTSGRGRGACMDSYFNKYLIRECRDIVCPGDPFAVVETGAQRGVQTTSFRAGEGGGFSAQDQAFFLEEEFSKGKENSGGGSKGTDPSNVKTYLFAGIAVVVLLSMTMGKRK